MSWSSGQTVQSKLSPSITLLPSILERIPLLVFTGDQDFICNYMGLESMVKSMTWNGKKGLGVCHCSCTSMLDCLTFLYIEGTKEAVERE